MKIKFPLSLLFLLGLFMVISGWVSSSAMALDYCVDDEVDGPANTAGCDATCTDGTHDCSIRDAITAANAHAGLDNIIFAIPGAGVHTLIVTMAEGKLPSITSPVVIDGYTQPGSSPNTNGPTQGTNAVLNIEIQDNTGGCCNDLLTIITGGSGSTIKGLVLNNAGGNQLAITGSNNFIEGNFLGPNPDGTTSTPNGQGLSIVSGSGNTVGGITPAARNLISGNQDFGAFIGGSTATNNVFQGNLIGTDRTGTVALPNANDGLRIVNFSGAAHGNTVGGTSPEERNILSGNSANGVRLFGVDVTANIITGNFIGVDVTGLSALGNNQSGVRTDSSAADNRIGGPGIGEGNVIAYNKSGGVFVTNGAGNAILSNSIFSNTGLGISLNSGSGNNNQAAPVLAEVSSSSCQTDITGSLSSNPDTTYRIEFFQNPPGPDIEGMSFIGFTNVMTDGSGDVNFMVNLPLALAAGQMVTATATDTDNNINDTSQFSNAVEVMGGSNTGTLQFSTDAYSVNEDGGMATITVTRQGGSECEVSVDYSTFDGTAVAGMDYLTAMGTLVWSDGDTADKSFTVDILDDNLQEGSETVNLALANPMGATLGVPNMAVLTILDNDSPAVDLTISKSVNPDQIQCGEQLTYTLMVGNNGPEDAENVSVIETLPSGMDLASIRTTQGSCDRGTLICNLGNLPAGAAAVTIEVTVTANEEGTFLNTATVTGTQNDSDPSNNTATVEATVAGGFCGGQIKGAGCQFNPLAGRHGKNTVFFLLLVLSLFYLGIKDRTKC